jgi:general secretion pathway protein H
MDNRSLALRLTGEGYAFERRDRGEWQALERKPFAPARWQEGTEVAARDGRERLVFDPTGFAEPLELTLMRDGQKVAVAIADGGNIRVVP